MVDLEDLYEPPADERYESLRDDIKEHGVRIPIQVTPSGVIIDGYTRKRICDELRIDCPEIVMHDAATHEQAVAIAILANSRNRKLNPEQRADVVEALQTQGWSNRRIAYHLGVDEGTVRHAQRTISTAENSAVEKPAPARTTGRDGRARPATPPAPDEVEQRRDTAKELIELGYSWDAVRQSLGISDGTLRTDLLARGIDGLKRGRPIIKGPVPKDKEKRKAPPKTPKLPARVFEPDPPVVELPRYKTTEIFLYLRHFVRDFQEGDLANNLAFRVDEARDHHDEQWITDQIALIDDALDKLQRWRRILTDPEYQALCRDTFEGRENVRGKYPQNHRPKLRPV